MNKVLRVLKKFIFILVIFVLTSCISKSAKSKLEDIYIISTNDIHLGYIYNKSNNSIGFEYIAGTKEKLIEEGKKVLLVDAGDFIQNVEYDKMFKLEYKLDLLDLSHYDVLVPGNNEYRYGVLKFLEFSKNRPYISCNFVKNGKNVLSKYKMFDIGGRKVAFIGVTTPDTLLSSKFYLNSETEFNYDFSSENLIEVVQKTVDEVKSKGANIVILVAHLGNKKGTEYTSKKLITNTNNIDVVIDGHSHDIIEKDLIKNKDDKNVLVSQTGKILHNISILTIDKKGEIDTRFMKRNELVPSNTVKKLIDKIYGEIEVSNMENANSRFMNKNILGSFFADMYKNLTKSDIAFIDVVNTISNIDDSSITLKNIYDVNQSIETLYVVEIKGERIKEMLEWVILELYFSFGDNKFIQCSGITYENDMSISNVEKVEEEIFLSNNTEYKVENILINNEPINLDKKYIVTISEKLAQYFYNIGIIDDNDLYKLNIIDINSLDYNRFIDFN